MGERELVRKLRWQLRIERTIIVLIALFFIGRWAYERMEAQHYAIFADGRPVAVLSTRESAQAALVTFKKSIDPDVPADVSFKQKITVGRIGGRDRLMSEAQALEALKAKLTVQVMNYAIVVDGKPLVALDSEDDARAVLEAVKQRYGTMVDHLMEEPYFKEDVKVRKAAVDGAIHRDTVEEATEAIVSGAGDSSGVYTVSDGDIASEIAEKHGIRLSELKALNGGRDLDRLRIGDQLRVSMKAEPVKAPITVVVRDQEEETEVIPYRTESVSSDQMRAGKEVELRPGRNGLRRVVRAVTYENGVRTGMEVVEEELIRAAVARRVAIGTVR